MTKRIKRIIACGAIAGLVAGLAGCCGMKQYSAARPIIRCQPQDQTVPVGTNATFSVVAEKPPPFQWQPISYQWQLNQTPNISETSSNWTSISVGTNSSLSITNVQINDVGYYRVLVTGSDTVTSDAASLEVFTTSGGTITVRGNPLSTGGNSNPPDACPGGYSGYVNYKNGAAWGWIPATGPYSAADGTTRTDTILQMSGSSGDHPCRNPGPVTATSLSSAKYRFTIYFPAGTAVGGTNYPAILTGFQ